MPRARKRPDMNDPLYRKALIEEFRLHWRARIAAFEANYKGGDVAIARDSLPDLAPYIVDHGEGAQLDFAAASAAHSVASATQVQPIAQPYFRQLPAVTVLGGIGEHLLHFALLLVAVPVRFLRWATCWLMAIGLMLTVAAGPTAAGLVTMVFVASWFPVWGAVLTGIVVGAFLYYNLWVVEPINDAWTGAIEWFMDKRD